MPHIARCSPLTWYPCSDKLASWGILLGSTVFEGPHVVSAKLWTIVGRIRTLQLCFFFSGKNTTPGESGDAQTKWRSEPMSTSLHFSGGKPIRTLEQCNTSAYHILATKIKPHQSIYIYTYKNSIRLQVRKTITSLPPKKQPRHFYWIITSKGSLLPTYLEGAESPGFPLEHPRLARLEWWLKLYVQIAEQFKYTQGLIHPQGLTWFSCDFQPLKFEIVHLRFLAPEIMNFLFQTHHFQLSS